MGDTKNLLLNGRVYNCQSGETVLDALLRQKVEAPYSCRQQNCMSCLMRSLNGPPPTKAQINLKETLKLQNNFLACGCFPVRDMEISLLHESLTIEVNAQVAELNPLGPAMLELVLQCEIPIDFHGGQSVLLLNDEQIGKKFSIASPSSAKASGRIEVHVERIKDGNFSEWIYKSLKVGDQVKTCGVSGELFYTSGSPQQPLLLAAWNGNLGAMIGIIQDAFENEHVGPVYLFHSTSTKDDLYFGDEMQEISEFFPNFRYFPCVERGPVPEGCHIGPVDQLIQQISQDFSGWKVYLCGSRDQTHALQRIAYLAGAGMKDILIEVTSV